MFLKIKDVLPAEDLAAIRTAVEAAEFIDGAATGKASLKKNLQSAQGNPGLEGATRKVIEAITGRRDFKAFAAPRKMTLVFNRYDPGMFYKTHMDAALMGGLGHEPLRTDVSLTFFLSDPADYEGGELIVQSPLGEVRAKEAAGTVVVYPANMLHRVEPVTKGVRLAAIGWVQSVMRHAYQRELMFELHKLGSDISREYPDSPFQERIDRIKENLLRSWAEF